MPRKDRPFAPIELPEPVIVLSYKAVRSRDLPLETRELADEPSALVQIPIAAIVDAEGYDGFHVEVKLPRQGRPKNFLSPWIFVSYWAVRTAHHSVDCMRAKRLEDQIEQLERELKVVTGRIGDFVLRRISLTDDAGAVV